MEQQTRRGLFKILAAAFVGAKVAPALANPVPKSPTIDAVMEIAKIPVGEPLFFLNTKMLMVEQIEPTSVWLRSNGGNWEFDGGQSISMPLFYDLKVDNPRHSCKITNLG